MEISETESKLLCLNRGSTSKVQQLLKYLAAKECENKPVNEQLQSFINNLGEKTKKTLKNDRNNKEKLFNKGAVRDEIDIDTLDITYMFIILFGAHGKIPKSDNCKNLCENHLCEEAVKECTAENKEDCDCKKNKSVKCQSVDVKMSKCLEPECIKCNYRWIKTMRNKFAHTTPKMFKKINDDENHDFHEYIKRLAGILKLICSKVSKNCKKDCSDCKTIKKVLEKKMSDYLPDVFNLNDALCSRERELRELVKKEEVLEKRIKTMEETISYMIDQKKEGKDFCFKLKVESKNADHYQSLLDADSELFKRLQDEFTEKIKQMFGDKVDLHKFSFTYKSNYLLSFLRNVLDPPEENTLNVVLQIKSDEIPEEFRSLSNELISFCKSFESMGDEEVTVTFIPPPEISSIKIMLEVKKKGVKMEKY